MPATLTTLPGNADVDQVVTALGADGGVVLADFLDPVTRESIWDDLGPAFEAQAWGEEGFIGNRTRRVPSLFARTRHSATIVTDRRYHDAAAHSCGNRCRPGSVRSGPR